MERHLLELDDLFGLEFIVFDPWQAEHLGQTLEADTTRKRRNQRQFVGEPWVRELPPTATNLRAQASLTIEFFNDRRVQLYDCEPLRRDLHKLRIEEKSYGFRLVSPRDGDGHGDCFSAFALALVVAHEVAGKETFVVGPFNGTPKTWQEAFQSRASDYQADLDLFNSPDPDPSGFLDAVREGRVFRCGP